MLVMDRVSFGPGSLMMAEPVRLPWPSIVWVPSARAMPPL